VAGAGSNFFAGRKAQTGFPDELREARAAEDLVEILHRYIK